jgi:hypothetical protein
MIRDFGLTKRQVVRDNYTILKEIKYNSLYYLVNSLHKYIPSCTY